MLTPCNLFHCIVCKAKMKIVWKFVLIRIDNRWNQVARVKKQQRNLFRVAFITLFLSSAFSFEVSWQPISFFMPFVLLMSITLSIVSVGLPCDVYSEGFFSLALASLFCLLFSRRDTSSIFFCFLCIYICRGCCFEVVYRRT